MITRFLKWLLSLLEKKVTVEVEKPPEPTTDLYKPTERFIYKYFNGNEMVAVDPIDQYKKVMNRWPEIKTDMTICTHPAGSNNSFKAHGKLVKAIREEFGVKPLAEGGLTDQECADLLANFLLYANEVKKNLSLLPIVPEAIRRGSENSSGESPPTESSSVSGETKTGSATDESEKPKPPSASPSECSHRGSVIIETLPMESAKPPC